MHGSKAITLSSGDWQRAARAASRGRVNCARHELREAVRLLHTARGSRVQGNMSSGPRLDGLSPGGWIPGGLLPAPRLWGDGSHRAGSCSCPRSVWRGEGRRALAVALGSSPAGGRRGRVASFRDERQLWGCRGPGWGRTQELPTDRPQCGRDAEKASGGLKGRRRLAFSRASRTRGLWGRLPGAA